MFDKVGDADFVAGEHEMLRFWKDRAIFQQLRAKNAGKPAWSFLDGPITANNPMGVHHAWGRTYKDAFQRFWAMNGRELRYQNGFDCQGLWVEVEVEKQLGLGAKSAIEAYGVDKFVWECKKRVLRYAAIQTEQSIRLGYWMEWDDPATLRRLADAIGTDAVLDFHPPKQPEKTVRDTAEHIVERLGNPDWGGSYFTFSTENNETIWTFLKKCYQRGKVYRGHDVMPWSGKAGSAYSQMEVADGRKLTVHRALFVRFPIVSKGVQEYGSAGENAVAESLPPTPAPPHSPTNFKSPTNEYILVWTTTPWTLTSNVAAMVNPDLEYVQLKAKRDGAIYYFAKDNLDFQRLAKEHKEGFGRPEWEWPKDVPKLKTIAQIFKEHGGYDVLGAVKGADMIGWRYQGPFDDLPAQQQPGGSPFIAGSSTDVAEAARFGDSPKRADSATLPTGVTCHRVIDGGRDFKGSPNVVAGEGTGIVHSAPGCGDVDHQIGLVNDLVSIAPLGEDGRFLDGFGPFTGKNAVAPETVDLVIEELKRKELLVAVEKYPHVYPFCWRTGDELVFRLVDEWFINMDWRDEIMGVTRQITWLPDSIQGEEREIEWLANMRDWMISKKRYWGLALPIWINPDDPGDFEVMGSLAELKERAVDGTWDEFTGHTPHKPWIDKVKIRSQKTNAVLSRIPDVGNPWLDAGIVPFSTLGFNTHPDFWKRWYPADLVTECFPGQFRNWFYSMLSMSTMMRYGATDDPAQKRPFKTLLGHRLVMDELGRPMHKSDGTAIWFEEAAEQLGVDTLRWLYLQQNPSQDLRFGTRHPGLKVTLPTVDGPKTTTIDGVPTCLVSSTPADDVRRMVLLPLWNSYKFFVNYAQLDDFDPTLPEVPFADRPQLDRWILTNLQETVRTVRQCMGGKEAEERKAESGEPDEEAKPISASPHSAFRSSAASGFNTPGACTAIAGFIDDLSNWYIRRNRDRFWRSKDATDTDKRAAYQTLYRVLETLTRLLAPFTPFLAERMYQNLSGRTAVGSSSSKPQPLALNSQPESVHLCDYPVPDAAWEDRALLEPMQIAQRVVRLAHRLREEIAQRVRQPLAEVRVASQSTAARLNVAALQDVICDELNVKQVVATDSLSDIVAYKYRANPASLGKKHGKLLAKLRELIPTLPADTLTPLREGGAVDVKIGDDTITLVPEDVSLSVENAAGWASAADGDIQIALSTALTPALVREGMARDFVRHVQQLRKDADLDIEQHIHIRYETTEAEAQAAITEWSAYIQGETLADRLTAGQPADGKIVTVGEAQVVIAMAKA